jgi:hypothetical protein
MTSTRNLTFAIVASLLATPALVLADYSRDEVIGQSEGKHRLDCTILRPWAGDGTPAEIPAGGFQILGWTNGWGQGNVFGADQVENYIDGLDFWVEDGNYLVIAANQWSARAPDILQCLQWLIDQSYDENSDYFNALDTSSIGLSGHSQGGGAALKAGDGLLKDGAGYTQISTVAAMNPYGPSFVTAQNQNDQILILSGDSDNVTPTDSMSAVIDGVILSGTPGGLLAELVGGTHCNPACRDDFGVFGEAALLWFDIFLRDETDKCVDLMNLLVSGAEIWNLEYSNNFVCAGD